MDGGAWWAVVPGIAKSQTQLSDFTFTFHFHALEKEMATYSSVLAWRIPGTGEPGGLPSLGSHTVGHDWSDLAAAAAAAELQKQNEHEVISSWAKVFKFSSSKPCGLWVMVVCQCRFISCNKCTTLMGTLMMGEADLYLWEPGVFLYLPLYLP